MGRQLFQDGPYIDTYVGDGTPLTSTSAEALWLGTQYTPIYANDAKAGKVYCVRAGGIMSTGASGTLIIEPKFGAIGGVTLGASQTVTVPINMSGVAWYLSFDMAIRTIVTSSSTAIGTGFFVSAPKVSAPTVGLSFVVPFGGTSATIDITANSGITISKTLNIAGSMTVQFAYIFSRN